MSTFSALFLFAGIGAGALGFLNARMTVHGAQRRFVSIGGVDNDPVACRDFERLTRSPALCADLTTMTAAELRAFAGAEAPDVVFMSPPCKGFSGLMSPTKAATPKYQDMNRLAVRSVDLLLETWGAEGPGLILLENVPRIATRGAELVKALRKRLRAAGYVTHEGTHNCGKIGRLGQSRERFLMVARHARKVPVFLYQPEEHPLRGCGEVIGPLPLPGAPEAGRLHRLPEISYRTWLRLAAIRPGKDWRDLSTLDGETRPAWRRYAVTAWGSPTGAVAGSGTNSAWGVADLRVEGAWQASVLGVVPETQPFGTITGRGGPTNGAFSFADLRFCTNRYAMNWRVLDGAAAAPTITGTTDIQAGAPSYADLRLGCGPNTHNNILAVTPSSEPTRTITGASRPASGAPSVADLRLAADAHPRAYGVLPLSSPAATITGNVAPGGGACSVADLRITCTPWRTSGVLGVLDWARPSYTVTGSLDLWAGFAAVADPRVPQNPALPVRLFLTDLDAPPPFVPVIPGRGDGSWHRPLTLLERAVLQGLPAVVDGEPLHLEGPLSLVSEHIGNAVPVQAAEAIASEMLRTLAVAAAGAFMLSGTSAVWVRPRRNGSFPLYAEAPRRPRKPRRAAARPRAVAPCEAVAQIGGAP